MKSKPWKTLTDKMSPERKATVEKRVQEMLADDAPRLQQPGEIGFAGKTVQDCSIHGAVLWCVCMRTPEEQVEAERQQQVFADTVLAAAEALLKEKRFAVEYSGYGSAFVRDEVPELMTCEEAKQEVYRWCGIADTIGGLARVYDVETGRVIWWPQ